MGRKVTGCAAGVMIAASVLVAGCAGTVDGTAVRSRGAGVRDVAPLDEAGLDRILLPIAEVNSIVGSTQMKVTGELDEMTDHSDEVSHPECVGALYGAEEPAYAGTGWFAVRDQLAHESDEDSEHWVEQTAVLYPGSQNAQAFFDASLATWTDCADHPITVGDDEELWQLGDVEVSDALITQMTAEEGADGWACQHALSLVSNLTVEAWVCGYGIADEAAEIATAMIENAAAK